MIDGRLLECSRQGLLSPQSPDEDLASRLFLRARALLRSAEKVGARHPEAAALLCHVALHHFGRGLLSAKGYRPTDKEPHRTVALLSAHFLNGSGTPTPLQRDLLDHWTTCLAEPDMPLPRLPAAGTIQGTRRLLRALEKILLKEFPAFGKLFHARKKDGTVSPERAFRD